MSIPRCTGWQVMKGKFFPTAVLRTAKNKNSFLKNTSGAIAMEFALIAPMFFLLLMAILEVSIMTFSSAGFDDAGRAASRLLKTGVAQKSGNAETMFRDGVCDALPTTIDCNAVDIDVRTFEDFGSTTTLVVLDDAGNPDDLVFAPGDSTTVNMVRLTYRWEFFTPMIGNILSDNGTNSVLLMTVSIFQTEPY